MSKQAIEQRLSHASAVFMRAVAVRVSAELAKPRRQRANKPITYPPKGSQVQVPGKHRPKPRRPGKQKRQKVSPARLR